MSNISRWVFARNGNAVASVLFAIAGYIGFGLILGPIAVGLGLLARNQIAQSYRPGLHLAVAGIVLGVGAFVSNLVLAMT